MMRALVNWPAANHHPKGFIYALMIVGTLSLVLFFMCRWRRWTAIIAVVFATIWVGYLLPDTQYYLDTRYAPADSIVDPISRSYYIRGYVLVLLPVPFVLFGLWRRGKSAI